jgi:predicted DNA-binding transcriptional regulator YafY
VYHATRPVLRRIMFIDQALRAGRSPNAATLSRELGASRRTIARDIEFMRDQLGAPLEFDPVGNGFVYTDLTYRLPYFQMTEGELVGLYLAERMMRQMRGTPFEADLRRAIAKLNTMLPDGVSVRLDDVADMLTVLPASQSHYDPECFRALTTAVVCRRRVDMVYFTASRKKISRRDFDPYEMALIDDGWYAVGYCHNRRAVLMFAVQRVQAVKPTGDTFDRPSDFRLEEYLKGSFRALRGDGDYDVVLRFSPDVADRVEERRWHPSQAHERQDDGGLILRFHVSDLREVKRWVMAWGADCRVVEPKELRDLIVDELNRMLGNDEEGRRDCPSNGRGGLNVLGRGRNKKQRRGRPCS